MGMELLKLTLKVAGQKIIRLEHKGLQGTAMSHIKWRRIPITTTNDY